MKKGFITAGPDLQNNNNNNNKISDLRIIYNNHGQICFLLKDSVGDKNHWRNIRDDLHDEKQKSVRISTLKDRIMNLHLRSPIKIFAGL